MKCLNEFCGSEKVFKAEAQEFDGEIIHGIACDDCGQVSFEKPIGNAVIRYEYPKKYLNEAAVSGR